MRKYLPAYLSALWKHWRAVLMSGSLMALAVIWTVTGNTIWPAVGFVIMLVTFFAASFGAWNEQRTSADELRADIAERERRYMTITEVVVGEGVAQAFVLRVHLVNPGQHPASFLDEWTLRITKPNGEVGTIRGKIAFDKVDDQLIPMVQGAQFNIKIVFFYGGDIPDGSALEGATYELQGSDIERRPIAARYPSSALAVPAVSLPQPQSRVPHG
jgi:hypothetical protein